MIRKLGAAARRVRRLFETGDSLAERTVSGGVWLSSLAVVDRIIRFGTFISLSHVLSPAEFGLLGLGTLALTVLRHVSKLGIDAALIQREETDVDGYLDTAWLLSIGRGVAVALAAFALAPYAASVFDAPRLTAVVRALALVPLLGGLRNPGVVYFRKKLAFDKQFGYAISATLVFAATAIGVGLVSPSVWALVAATVAGTATKTVVSYAVHPYRPGLSFDREAARELLNYGKWIFGSGFVLLALNWGDDALVGLVLGSAALGLYQMAFRLSCMSVKEVTDVVSSVTFPAFSRVQGDTAALREAYYRSARLVAYVSLPMAVGIAAIAPVFVRTFLGPEWLAVASVMRVMAAWGALRSLVATVGPLFRAIGEPKYNTALQFARMVVLTVVIYPLTTAGGVEGVALALVVSGFVENPVAMYLAVRSVDGSLRRLLRSFAVPTALSAVMAVAVVLAHRALPEVPGVLEVAVLIPLGALVYAGGLLAVNHTFDIELSGDVASLRATLD